MVKECLKAVGGSLIQLGGETAMVSSFFSTVGIVCSVGGLGYWAIEKITEERKGKEDKK